MNVLKCLLLCVPAVLSSEMCDADVVASSECPSAAAYLRAASEKKVALGMTMRGAPCRPSMGASSDVL